MFLGIHEPKASSPLYPAVQAVKRLLEKAGRMTRRRVLDGWGLAQETHAVHPPHAAAQG